MLNRLLRAWRAAKFDAATGRTPDVFGVGWAVCGCGGLKVGVGDSPLSVSYRLPCPYCGQVLEVVGRKEVA